MEGEPLHQQDNEHVEEEHLRQQLAEFTWFELSNLPTYDKYKDELGRGTYGSLYKAVMNDNTTVAIRILDQNRWQVEPGIDQKIATLGKIRHPNLVTLIGACPKGHALVYEYLPKGNLEERLLKSEQNRDQVLSWSERTKIAASICSTLVFLHNTKPYPIVHANLKPENILFDSQNVCKLGDFGISRFFIETVTAMYETKMYIGPPVYMDPEHYDIDRINQYATAQSDVYAFGIILLQLVTGESSARGLRYKVLREIGSLENFIKKDERAQKMILGRFRNFSLDWPIDEAVKMTCLGIRCSEYLRENRPDLEKDVLVEIVHGFASIDI